VRKIYDYSGVLLLIMSRLLAATVPVQHHTLPEEGYDATSYLVRYGGSGYAYALHLHFLRFICFEVLCWHEVDMRSIIFIYMRSIVLFICGCGLFIIYHDLNFIMKILLD
jgi:hypothetical protein